MNVWGKNGLISTINCYFSSKLCMIYCYFLNYKKKNSCSAGEWHHTVDALSSTNLFALYPPSGPNIPADGQHQHVGQHILNNVGLVVVCIHLSAQIVAKECGEQIGKCRGEHKVIERHTEADKKEANPFISRLTNLAGNDGTCDEPGWHG